MRSLETKLIIKKHASRKKKLKNKKKSNAKSKLVQLELFK